MVKERALLAELHALLRNAWDKGELPAAIVPAELARRVEACLADTRDDQPLSRNANP